MIDSNVSETHSLPRGGTDLIRRRNVRRRNVRRSLNPVSISDSRTEITTPAMRLSELPIAIALLIAIVAIAIGRAATPVSAQTRKPIALTNITLIDGGGGRPLPNMTVVISGERISDLHPVGKKKLPPGASVMSLKEGNNILGSLYGRYGNQAN